MKYFLTGFMTRETAFVSIATKNVQVSASVLELEIVLNVDMLETGPIVSESVQFLNMDITANVSLVTKIVFSDVRVL